MCEISFALHGIAVVALVSEEKSYSRAVSECITMVAFEVHRMADISRSQLVSACRTLGVKLGDVKSSSKITVTALIAKVLVEQGVVRAVNQPLSIF